MRPFWLALLLNAVWINASEIFRYFVFVMPMLRKTLASIDNVAPMNAQVFLLWGIWDALLVVAVTGFVWLFLDRYETSNPAALLAGTLAWLGIFGILWLGMYNMNLATPAVLAIALPLSWIEIVVAAFIVRFVMRRHAASVRR